MRREMITWKRVGGAEVEATAGGAAGAADAAAAWLPRKLPNAYVTFLCSVCVNMKVPIFHWVYYSIDQKGVFYGVFMILRRYVYDTIQKKTVII